MKNPFTISIFLISGMLLFSSCSYVQLLDVCSDSEASKSPTDNGKYYFVHSDSNVRVTYNFWGNQGVMSFAVYNNLNVPMYIDLKKSAFISNGNKLDYWQDETNTETIGLYQSYSYKGITIGGGKSYSTQTRDQRIISIPPHSYTSVSKFRISLYSQFDMKEKSIDYSSSGSSPIRFRNYLVLSTSENFKDEFYVDNSFYVCKVTQMSKKKFNGDMVMGDNNTLTYEYPYYNNTSFYILHVKPTRSSNYGANPDL